MKSIFTFFLTAITLIATAQYDIDIKVKNYDGDTIVVGNYYADRQLVVDTLVGKKGKYEFEGQDTLKPGVYFLLETKDKTFVQFFVNGQDNEFKISWDVTDNQAATFKGSEDNEVFADYLGFLAEQRKQADVYRARITAADTTGVADPEADAALDKIDEMVSRKQFDIINKYRNTVSSRFVKSSQQTDIPEFKGTEKEKQFKVFRYYKEHYFDNLDLGDPVNLRTPYMHERVNYYVEKLTQQDPDSTKVSVDYLLNKMEPSEETFKYYLSYFLNKYAKMKIVGFDALYVHIVDNYYAKGRAPWVTEENLKKMKDQANNYRPILIGQQFPDITTYKADNAKTPVRLRDIDSKYTVVLFWAHDCGHCTKSMPDVVDFYNEFEGKGVTVLSICTKGGKKTTACQESIAKKKMEKFINTFDEFQRYRRSVYIPSTPKIFILDKDKNILIKDIPAKNLKEIMPQIIQVDEEKGGVK